MRTRQSPGEEIFGGSLEEVIKYPEEHFNELTRNLLLCLFCKGAVTGGEVHGEGDKLKASPRAVTRFEPALLVQVHLDERTNIPC
jgi:hypothetical protein